MQIRDNQKTPSRTRNNSIMSRNTNKRKETAERLYKEGFKKEMIIQSALKYSIDRDGVVKNPNGKIVGSPNGDDYYKIQVTFGGKIQTVFTHRIQAYKKFGNAMYKGGIMVRHLNDIKSDNSYSNIELGTAKDNYSDRGEEAIKESQRRATEGSRKYSAELIQEAKEYFEKYKNLNKTSLKFNIPSSTLHYRLYGKKKQIR